jgi:hypothetical protein
MAKQIRVSRASLNAAKPGDEVFGKDRGIDVVVILGREVDYTATPKDDPNTEYRCFVSCDLYYYQSKEDAINDSQAVQVLNQVVILFG